MQNENLSVKETAKLIGKHENTIYNMIGDGRLKASKTSDGKYQISRNDIYLFELENSIKDNLEKVESSVEIFTNNIDEEILKNSDRLYAKICDKIISFHSSDEFKERNKIVKILKGKNKIEDEKQIKVLNRLREINHQLNIKQKEILKMLRYDLEEYYELCDLKYEITSFGRKVETRSNIELDKIENKWEERW